MYILPNRNLLKCNEDLEKDNYYHLKELIYDDEFKDKMMIAVGKTDQDVPIYTNLKNDKGILIIGETGSGKSMFIHSIIIDLLFKNTPDDLNFILMAKNKVELSNYDLLPHLCMNIANTDKEILESFIKIVDIIKERRNIFHKNKVNDIDEYNLKNNDKLPEILIIVDEIGNLINLDEISNIIKNILKDGYKYGIHLILATSSYLKDYKDNNLINNFDYVVTFDLASKEQENYVKITGASLLKIEGDVYVKSPNMDTCRLQTPYISLSDVSRIVQFIVDKNKVL